MQVYLLGILQRFPIFDPERVGSATKRFLCARAGEVFIFHAPLFPCKSYRCVRITLAGGKSLLAIGPRPGFHELIQQFILPLILSKFT